MPELYQRIRDLVLTDRYLVSEHAVERLLERGILEWQVVAGMAEGELAAENPEARPNPVAEIREILPDGTPILAVWSHIRSIDVAKLVTVHYLD